MLTQLLPPTRVYKMCINVMDGRRIRNLQIRNLQIRNHKSCKVETYKFVTYKFVTSIFAPKLNSYPIDIYNCTFNARSKTHNYSFRQIIWLFSAENLLQTTDSYFIFYQNIQEFNIQCSACISQQWQRYFAVLIHLHCF